MRCPLTFFIIIVLTSNLVSCKRKDSGSYFPLNPEFKAAYSYAPGTYWIYKDSLTGRIDSFFVRSSEVSDYSESFTEKDELADIYISEYQIKPAASNDSMSWRLQLVKNNFLLYYYHDIPNKTVFTSEWNLFSYPWTIGMISGLGGDRDHGFVTHIFPLLTIGNNAYDSVCEIHHYQDSILTGYGQKRYDNWFYVSRKSGIVKMRLNYYNDSVSLVWELQRCSISKL